jgi:hypothetical protein
VPKSAPKPAALFLSSNWFDEGSEVSFVIRSLAGAGSRSAQVMVAAPGREGRTPDGAFDVVGLGPSSAGEWPDDDHLIWPDDVPANSTVVIDQIGAAPAALLRRLQRRPTRPVLPQMPDDPAALPLRPTVARPDFIGIEVPVNPMAAEHRHSGFGFTDYFLVLTDRAGRPDPAPPTDGVAWLTAAFHDDYVVVVEGAQASAWKGRALRGNVAVDTRTDLWRLMAHARLTVDLSPGPVIGRECIESLRFGTPAAVPASSAAACWVASGGVICFDDYPDLVRQLERTPVLAELGARGRQYADHHFGDSDRFTERVNQELFA